ncbi:alpha amylase [Coprinopsis sp. MPI-PUGE-AT-0042]|nr:alpha amylase [Coprinopsis sp. MPI-PUGE-AT-0042]
MASQDQEESTLIPFGRAWWKEAVVYQIYPISFFDSNGDGIGDLNGIASKLDYLKDLGVDVLWLSPIYKSPLADMGYDMCVPYSSFGCLGLHGHEWFIQSRSSKSHPKRDWYIWRPPKYDADGNRHPPNNWSATFQGSAWDFDETTQEYYLHLYLPEQPDLNWENEEVRHAVYDMMKFWLDRGCDGFRMDVINIISKVEGLPDAPVVAPEEPYQPASAFFANGPRAHEFVKEMNTEVLSKYDIITVGETPFTHDATHLASYVLPANKELNMVFQFEAMEIDAPKRGEQDIPLQRKEWKLSQLKEIITRWQNYKRDEGFWNTVYTENHDHARSVSRFGDDSDEWRPLSAKLLAMLQVMQCGTQFVYQGQELGLKNFPTTWGIEEYKDIASQNFWFKTKKEREAALGSGDAVDMTDILADFACKARDHARVPMQWDSTMNAGFTSGTPWMRVNEDYERWNAHNQIGDDNSVLAFWKTPFGSAKREHGFGMGFSFIYGDFEDLSEGHESAFVFIRRFGAKLSETTFSCGSSEKWGSFSLLLGNYGDDNSTLEDSGKITLRGWEARCYHRK